MKLIVICGARHSKKSLLAHRLADKTDWFWIKPYSDKKVAVNCDPVDDKFIMLNRIKLNHKMEREVPLAETVIAGNRYVFFENQLKGDCSIIVGDDRIAFNLKNSYEGDLVTIKCHSDIEVGSYRHLMDDDEFDIVFHYDSDDLEELVREIEVK